MDSQAVKTAAPEMNRPLTSYHEVMLGKTLYRVTSVYKGDIELKRALEDLTISRALRDAPAAAGAGA